VILLLLYFTVYFEQCQVFFVNSFKMFTVLVCLTPEKAYYKKVQVFIVHLLSLAAVMPSYWRLWMLSRSLCTTSSRCSLCKVCRLFL